MKGRRTLALCLIVFAAILVAPTPSQAAAITLRPIAGGFSSPIGIDYHEPTNTVVTSAYFPTGHPHNFERIAQNGTRTPFSSAAGLTEELKIATVRSGPCQGGFAAGELFSGTGTPGVILRISPSGSVVENPWVTLPGETGLLRGGLFHDRYCTFGGDLIVVTKAGGVWRVTSAKVVTKVAQIPTPLEGVTTVPNDPGRYGPWSGRILAGAEDAGCVYAIDAAGSYACTKLPKAPYFTPDDPIRPEDIDIVPPNENFFGVDFAGGTVWGAEAAQFSGMVGDFVIPQEYGAHLYRVRWSGSGASFVTEELAQVTHWEHVTFAPAGVDPIPPACPVPDIAVTLDRPAAGRFYQNDVDAGPSGSSEAVAIGPTLTAQATSSNPAITAQVRFLLDGVVVATDATAPYSAPISLAVPPGLHTLDVEAQQSDKPGCVARASRSLRIADPGVTATATGVFAATNVPAEPVVRAGGATAGSPSGAQTIRILDQRVPGVVEEAAITDRALTSTSGPALHAEAESQIDGVSILGGLVTADVLHARVRADYGAGPVAADDGSLIAGLRVGGVNVTAVQPNMVVPLPGGIGHVTLQETIVEGTGFRREITVNMVHVFLDTPSLKTEVILASAHAGVNLAGTTFAGPAHDLIHRPDDAGSKTDAAPTNAGALPIAPGVWSGAMTPGDDSDFYAFETLQGERIVAGLDPSPREVVRQNPIAPGPPPVAGAPAYAVAAAGQTSATGPVIPNFDLYLYDPAGLLRERSLNAGLPDRVELNADTPYAPPGARGRWVLEVRRAPGSPDGFYTLDLGLPPSPLLPNDDAGMAGDAPGTCAAGRVLPPSVLTPAGAGEYAVAGVLRDADFMDVYWIQAGPAQRIAAALKPDAGADGANFDLYAYAPLTAGGAPNCGGAVAFSVSGAAPPKGIPDAVLVTASVQGTYALLVNRVNGVGNYALSITVSR